MYVRPSPVERAFNAVFGVLVGLGIGARHNYRVEVAGRTSGRVRAVPVNLLVLHDRRFLVAGRGRTHWVRNAEAAGRVTLRRGRTRRAYAVRALPDAEKPEVLKAYVDRFTLTVQRYFPVAAGSPAGAFAGVAARYPVFELTEAPAG